MELTKEMKNYIARGIQEENEKDTYNKPNTSVRWHLGMYHETSKLVRDYQILRNSDNTTEYEVMKEALCNCAKWWKNYFDVSPEYAREQKRLEDEAWEREYEANKRASEAQTLADFMEDDE